MKEVRTIETDQGEVWAGDFNFDGSEFVFIYNGIAPDGETIRSGVNVYSTSDWTLKVNLADDECKRRYCLKCSPKEGLIATGNDRNCIEIWNTGTKVNRGFHRTGR